VLVPGAIGRLFRFASCSAKQPSPEQQLFAEEFGVPASLAPRGPQQAPQALPDADSATARIVLYSAAFRLEAKLPCSSLGNPQRSFACDGREDML